LFHRFGNVPGHRLMSQSILVTGGAGYVGSHACKVLAAAGYRPVVYDNLSRGHAEAVRWGPLVRGDLHDRARLVEAMRAHCITAVMHFAAFAYVGESVSEPELYYRNNVGGTLALLDAMREAAVETIVFSSTCAIYGVPDALPIREDAAKAPLNPYGDTKLAIERALHWYAGAYGLKYMALRYFNAAGADPDGALGEDHDPELHLIPRAIDAALGRGDFAIYGTDYDTPDGTCLRDYVHVSDLASAHLLALEALRAGAGSTSYNLGNGKPISVREVVTNVERVTGRKVPPATAPRRPGDPGVLFASSEKIRRELGWQPRYEAIDVIVETAWRWREAHPRGYEDRGSRTQGR